MFYDPTCKPETKTDQNSLEALIGWLEMQPASGIYDFFDVNGGCLIGIYGISIGMGEEWGKDWHYCHHQFYKRDELWVASQRPHTFGAALERARKCQSNGGGCESI